MWIKNVFLETPCKYVEQYSVIVQSVFKPHFCFFVRFFLQVCFFVRFFCSVGVFFFGSGCFQVARYTGQSLLQEGGAGHTCMPCWAGYFLLDYKKGDRPQPYSCPQVASSEACLTALGPCSPCLGGGIGKIGETKGSL